MEWIVKNAANPDVERQHLNKILQDIRLTIASMSSQQAAVENKTVKVTTSTSAGGGSSGGGPRPFDITLDGDVVGTGRVTGSNPVTISTTIPDKLPLSPNDGNTYWRQGDAWEPVLPRVVALQFLDGDGVAVWNDEDQSYEIHAVVPLISFGYGDASPAVVYRVEVPTEVIAVSMEIDTPFNGVGASVSLGTSSNPDSLIDPSKVDLSVAAVWEYSPREELAVGTEVVITITPGAGASTGHGQIYLQTARA